MSDKQFKEMMLLAGVKTTKEVRAKSLNESVTVVFKRNGKKLMKESARSTAKKRVHLLKESVNSPDIRRVVQSAAEGLSHVAVRDFIEQFDHYKEAAKAPVDEQWIREHLVDGWMSVEDECFLAGINPEKFITAVRDQYGVELSPSQSLADVGGALKEDIVAAAVREATRLIGNVKRFEHLSEEELNELKFNTGEDDIAVFLTAWESQLNKPVAESAGKSRRGRMLKESADSQSIQRVVNSAAAGMGDVAVRNFIEQHEDYRSAARARVDDEWIRQQVSDAWLSINDECFEAGVNPAQFITDVKAKYGVNVSEETSLGEVSGLSEEVISKAVQHASRLIRNVQRFDQLSDAEIKELKNSNEDDVTLFINIWESQLGR